MMAAGAAVARDGAPFAAATEVTEPAGEDLDVGACCVAH